MGQSCNTPGGWSRTEEIEDVEIHSSSDFSLKKKQKKTSFGTRTNPMRKFNLATLVMIFPPLTTCRPHLAGHLSNHVADSSWVTTFHLTLWQRNVMIGLLHVRHWAGTGHTGPNKTPCLHWGASRLCRRTHVHQESQHRAVPLSTQVHTKSCRQWL